MRANTSHGLKRNVFGQGQNTYGASLTRYIDKSRKPIKRPFIDVSQTTNVRSSKNFSASYVACRTEQQ